jgi:hypothetical protein
MSSSNDPVDGIFRCLRIPLFSMSSSYDPVIGMFHCLFIVLKIPLFSMPSSHDPVIVTFHDCLFIAWENPTINSHTLQSRRSLIWSRFSDQNVPWLSFYCFTIALSSMRSSESIRMFYCLLIVHTVLYEMQSRSSQEA